MHGCLVYATCDRDGQPSRDYVQHRCEATMRTEKTVAEARRRQQMITSCIYSNENVVNEEKYVQEIAWVDYAGGTRWRWHGPVAAF